MDCISRLTVLAAVLVLTLNTFCHANNDDMEIVYRPFRVYANIETVLPCWELVNISQLILWITPTEVVVGPGYHDASSKYSIDFEGSLVVNVSELNYLFKYVFRFLGSDSKKQI